LEEVQREVDHIFDLAQKSSVEVFVGGMGFNLLSYEHSAVKKRLSTFEDVHNS
jgi:hypothetical protein